MPLLTMLEQERILKEKISNQNTILRRQKHAPAGRWVATEMCKGLSATPSRRGPNSRSSRICGVARLGGLLLQTNKQTNKQASNNDDDDDDCRMTNAHGYSVLQGTVECRKVKSAFKDDVALRCVVAMVVQSLPDLGMNSKIHSRDQVKPHTRWDGAERDEEFCPIVAASSALAPHLPSSS